jgi:hypothetical protein
MPPMYNPGLLDILCAQFMGPSSKGHWELVNMKIVKRSRDCDNVSYTTENNSR